jgi:hypothetical protein
MLLLFVWEVTGKFYDGMTVTWMFSLNKSSGVALFLAVYVCVALNVVDRPKQALKKQI